MKAPVFVLLILGACLTVPSLAQDVRRAPSGMGSLEDAWTWAGSQTSEGETSAVVWIIDSAGSNWRWGHQGPLLSELLSLDASGTAIVAILEGGEVSVLNSQGMDAPLRRAVSRVLFLGQVPQQDSFELLTSLRLANDDLGRSRLHVAAIHRDVPEAGAFILEALESQSRDTRKAAAHAWAQFARTDALPRLTTLAVNDADLEVAKAAAYAIGSVDDTAAVDALVAVLDGSSEREVRKAAAYALGNLGSSEAQAVLIRLIRTEQ